MALHTTKFTEFLEVSSILDATGWENAHFVVQKAIVLERVLIAHRSNFDQLAADFAPEIQRLAHIPTTRDFAYELILHIGAYAKWEVPSDPVCRYMEDFDQQMLDILIARIEEERVALCEDPHHSPKVFWAVEAIKRINQIRKYTARGLAGSRTKVSKFLSLSYKVFKAILHGGDGTDDEGHFVPGDDYRKMEIAVTEAKELKALYQKELSLVVSIHGKLHPKCHSQLGRQEALHVDPTGPTTWSRRQRRTFILEAGGNYLLKEAGLE